MLRTLQNKKVLRRKDRYVMLQPFNWLGSYDWDTNQRDLSEFTNWDKISFLAK